jgi:enterochelin esterase family protein
LSCLYFTNNANGQIPEESRSATTNISPNEYPCILPDLRVVFKVNAPDAGKVQIDLGKMYNMQKDEDGNWKVTTEPQEPGFHYYSLVIDGVKVADPASESFYGMGRMASGIDIPDDGVEFYSIKDVPHGDIRSRLYFSNTTQTWRTLNIYAPPGYDKNINGSYPVLYIQHGGGEDESGWAVQGKTNIILDNLIAEGKAVPMIIVIPNGNVSKPGVTAFGYTKEAMQAFKDELFENVIPFVESNYRIKTGAANRALAGLSMGGGQTFYTGLGNTDMFSSLGVFSSGIFGGIGNLPADALNPETIVSGILNSQETFNNKMKVFYISVGEQDPRIEPTKKFVETMKGKGLKVEFASFPGGHEWQCWRRSLHKFTQLLFKN